MARQYCGRLGKVANCQGGMLLAYVSPLGRALVDKRLYLPKSWTADQHWSAAVGCAGAFRSEPPLEDGVSPAAAGARLRSWATSGPQWVAGNLQACRADPVLHRGKELRDIVVPAGPSDRHHGPGVGACAWTRSPADSGFLRPRKPRPLLPLRPGQVERRGDELPDEATAPRSLFAALDPKGRAPTGSVPSGCGPPGGASPARNCGPSGAGTWTAASIATTCPTLLRTQPWRLWPAWVGPGTRTHNGVRALRRATLGSTNTRPAAGHMALHAHSHAPPGRSVPGGPAAGLGGKSCSPDQSRCAGWCVRCCPGSSSVNWRSCHATAGPETQLRNERPQALCLDERRR